MVLSKGILLKGLLGLGTLVGATTLGVVYREEIASLFTANGGDIAVGEGDQVDAGSQGAASTGSGDQVAEIASVTSDSQGSKGEASGKAGGAVAAEKKEVTVQQINEEVKKLNIDNCELEGEVREKTCPTFNKDNLKNLMFPIKEEGKELVIVGIDDGDNNNIKISLKVKKADDLDIFTSGTKYTIETNENITIKKQGDNSDTNRILLMEGTNPEFTVENGRLVRAWDAVKLGKKVGLTCKVDKEDKFTLKDPIKMIVDGKVQTLNISDASGKEISFSDETANYNQGFKFTYRGETITGNNGAKLEQEKTYEIKYQEGEGGGWGLSLVNSNN